MIQRWADRLPKGDTMFAAILKKVLPKVIKVGFGKAEALKTTKGLAVGGVGVAAVQILASYGWLPEAALDPTVMPYTVVLAGAAVNVLRQFVRDNTHHA
tara:strand:+ start:118 stop:414 length:297 start_codon:yes stop_codon:yes gene_type:complete